jgi:hypothetical protein
MRYPADRRRASCIGDGPWISISSSSASMCTRTQPQWRLPRRASEGKSVRASPRGLCVRGSAENLNDGGAIEEFLFGRDGAETDKFLGRRRRIAAELQSAENRESPDAEFRIVCALGALI